MVLTYPHDSFFFTLKDKGPNIVWQVMRTRYLVTVVTVDDRVFPCEDGIKDYFVAEDVPL